MLWLVIALCAAFALRALLLIDATGLWSDELYTVGKSFQPSFDGLLAMLRIDTHPPLYYSAVWVWAQWFPPTAVSLRFVSWLVYLAGSAVITCQAGALAGHRAQRAMACAALMAFCSPYPVRFAIEGKGYALLVLFVALAWWFRRRQSRWLYGVSVACSALTHYYGFFLFATTALWDAWRGQRRLSFTAVIAVLPSMAWMAFASSYLLRRGTGAWIGRPDFALFEDTLTRALGLWPFPKLLVVCLMGWAVLRWGPAVSTRASTDVVPLQVQSPLADRSGLLPSLWMVVAVVLVSFWKPLAFSRYFVVLLPALIPWLAVRAASWPFNLRGLRIAGVAFGLLMVSWWWHSFADIDPALSRDGSRESDQFQVISRSLANEPYRFSRRERLFNLSDRTEVAAGRMKPPLTPWGGKSNLDRLLKGASPPSLLWLADSGDLQGIQPRMMPLLRRVQAAGYDCTLGIDEGPYAHIWRCERLAAPPVGQS